jgi:hypothetical protein
LHHTTYIIIIIIILRDPLKQARRRRTSLGIRQHYKSTLTTPWHIFFVGIQQPAYCSSSG